MHRVGVLALALAGLFSAACGQVPKTTAAAPSAPPEIHSPEVTRDGTVTFRYWAPKASFVHVLLEGSPQPIPMTEDAAGLWTASTRLTPEYYGYRFDVDGAVINDPANPQIRPNLMGPTTVVLVPGASAQPWEHTDIPHGELHHSFYLSQSAQQARDVYVYTPPGYSASRPEPYPVLYLLHGYSDDASAWTSAGQANFILDRLIDEGKVKPMVVVMPLGYGTMEMIRTGWQVWSGNSGPLIKRNQVEFETQLLHEILPWAEKTYNLRRDSHGRAIAGLSMGGGESLYIGLNHPDVFSYVGAFSSAIVNNFDTDYAGRSRAPLTLLWMSCGTEDSLHGINIQFENWARTHVPGRVIAGDTPGMHTWMVWRSNLIAFAPLLFRDEDMKPATGDSRTSR